MRQEISVCLAFHNGSRFIEDQISSILNQLLPSDEIVIVDDCSKPHESLILDKFKDPRIRIYKNSINLGHVKTFEVALHKCKHDIIMLADQDDVWISGRIDLLLGSLSEPHVQLVCSNYKISNTHSHLNNESRKKILEKHSSGKWLNILGILWGTRLYYGCTMALKREFLSTALPFPKFVESHDLWLALHANRLGLIGHISEPTVIRRVHETNLTPNKRRVLYLVILSRILFLYQIIISFFRKFK
jgi:glycosyltransferase involved in cell wall biosynthesis